MGVKKIVALLLSLLMAVTLVGCKSSSTTAKTDFPNKPIELVVPFAAGGATDLISRALANTATKYMPNNQPVVVVNVSGGASIIGMTEVFKAKPDGYKVCMGSSGPIAILPHYGKAVYNYDGFTPIMRVVANPNTLVVRADAPWKTFDEWMDYVKKNPRTFTYGSQGAGLTGHLAMEGMVLEYGLDVRHVPFEGTNPSVVALLGGHVQGVVSTAQNFKAQIAEGKLRPLVNIGTNRKAGYKDIPWVNGQDSYMALVAPKGLPKEIQTILHDAFKKALEDPAFIEQCEKLGSSPAYAGPDELQKILTDSYQQYGQLLRKAGLIKK